MDNLKKQCIIVVDWCFMGKKNREYVEHLLLHCEVATALSERSLFACWRGQFGSFHSAGK